MLLVSIIKGFMLAGAIIKGPQYVPFLFTLHADIVPPTTLDPVLCLKPYNDSIYRMLQNFTQQINYWICTSQNCSYLGGVGVALDYSTLKVTWIGTGVRGQRNSARMFLTELHTCCGYGIQIADPSSYTLLASEIYTELSNLNLLLN